MAQQIYAPSAGLETWKNRVADPDTPWERTSSAFETAVFWEYGAMHPRGLHPQLVALLEQEESLRGCSLVASFPEHRVQFPGETRASQTDVWAIVRAPGGLVSLAVEGMAGESLAETVGEWRKDAAAGKDKRLGFLCDQLGLTEPPHDAIRYQLLRRTVSALLEAERIGATVAAMIVISFTDDARSKDDFGAFASCLGSPVSHGQVCRMPAVKSLPLFLGWLDAKPCTDAEIAAVAA